MESIQLAQMLADLSDLNAAQEAQAALAVVNANKTLPASVPVDTSSPEHPAQAAATNKLLEQPKDRQHQRVASSSDFISRTASPAKFDKFGRRILTPPLSRTNSAQGTPGTQTPREALIEDEVSRATSLMQLYEIRAKLKQQDNSSLLKARERINAIHARQQMQSHSPILHGEQRHATPDVPQSRFIYPRTPTS